MVFVPALTGLGAPHWDPHARGTIIGITRGTTRAHIVRATLEAIAFEVRDVLETLPELTALRVDGGAAANDLLCQFQADQVGLPVERPEIVETTALGAAFLAGLGTGVWSSTDDLRETWALDRRSSPAATATRSMRRTPAGPTRSSAPRAGPAALASQAVARCLRLVDLCLRLVDGLLGLDLLGLGLAELVVDLLERRTRAPAIRLRSSSISDWTCSVLAWSFSTARRAARCSFSRLAERGLGVGEPLVGGRAGLHVRVRDRVRRGAGAAASDPGPRPGGPSR